MNRKLNLIAAMIASAFIGGVSLPAYATTTRDEPNKCYVHDDGSRDFDNQQAANQWMQANPSATVKVTVNGGDNINRNYNTSNSNAASTARSIADAVAQGNAELAAQLLNQSSNRNEVLSALQANNSVSNNVLSALREVSATGGNASSMTNLRNAVSSSASATGGSGVGTVTVDGRVYYPSVPVAGAVISAAQTVTPGIGITVIRSGCVGQVDITDKRTLEATRGTLAGLFSWGYTNGFEQTVRAKTGNNAQIAKLQYGEWKVVGFDEKGRMIQEQLVEGFEYVIFAYISGGGAANGIVHNAVNNATGVNGNMNNSSFGTNVMEFSCSRKDQRILMTPPPSVTTNTNPVPQTFTIELMAQASADVAKMPGVKKNPGGKQDPNVCYGLTNGMVIYANGRSCQKALDDYMGTLPKPNAGAVATYVVKDASGKVLAERKVEGTPGQPGSATDKVTLPAAKP